MDRLPPPRNSETNETTPLMRDDFIAIDPELYAIGGATGVSNEPFYSLMVDDMDQLQLIVSGQEEHVNNEDFKPRLTENETKCRQQIPTDKSAKENKIAVKKVINTLFSVWMKFAPRRIGKPERQDSELFGPRVQHALLLVWRQIKLKTDVRPESEVIVKGLAKYIVDYMHRLQMERPENTNYVMNENFKEHVTEIVRKRWKQILVDDNTYQNDVDNVVETLFSAWLEELTSKSDEPESEDHDLLSPEALNNLCTAWRQIKAERDLLPDSKSIGLGLTKSLIDYVSRFESWVPDGEEYKSKKDLTKHLTDIVKVGWQHALDEIDEEERVRKEKKRRKINRERWRKRREVATVLWFYEPFSRMKFDAPWDCELCCMFFCVCFSAFFFQVLIHTMLLPWPLSIGIMGGLYMTQCPMHYLMPYMMMSAGVAGTTAILTRLSYVFYERCSRNEIDISWPWILLKVIEYVFMSFLIIQMYCFYSKTPSFEIGSPYYCNETFYYFVHYINYVSIGLASAWLLIYFIKLIIWFHIRKFPLAPRW